MPDFRYFVSYSGVKLPLRLVDPLEEAKLENRNSYIRAEFDERERVFRIEKLVYGEIELYHHYENDEDGALKTAQISMGGETAKLDLAADRTRTSFRYPAQARRRHEMLPNQTLGTIIRCSTGLPSPRCDAAISSMSSAVFGAYQTPSG
jgi:hypothetical protein